MYDPVADIGRLIDAAKAAPSVLNTQPWLFQIVADDRINLRAQPERWLQHIDPKRRELVISCGAALFNLRLALRVAGHDSVVWLRPKDEEVPAKEDRPDLPDLLASVEIVSARVHPPTFTEQQLYEAIWQRHTNRQPFEKGLVGLNILTELEFAALKERVYLSLLQRHGEHKLLADIHEANRKASEDTYWGVNYRRELLQYTGELILSRGLGIPPEAFGPLPANRNVPYRDLGLEWHALGERERMRFEKRTRLLVLSTNTNSRTDWLRAGQGLQRVLLTAARLNVAASFYTQPLEPSNKDRPEKLWPRAKSPQMIMRVGYCQQPAARTPRLGNDSLWEDLRT